jgi:hypothetical protein
MSATNVNPLIIFWKKLLFIVKTMRNTYIWSVTRMQGVNTYVQAGG